MLNSGAHQTIRSDSSSRHTAYTSRTMRSSKIRLSSIDQRAITAFDRTTLRPSVFSTCVDLGHGLLKPVGFAAFVTVAVVLTTRALRTPEPAVPVLLEQHVAPQLKEDQTLEFALAALQEEARGGEQLPTVDPAIEDLKNKVNFISGLIAVHRPGIKDVGTVAKEIVEISHEKGVDPFFIAAVISIESRFGHGEVSHVGARGLMQLMPDTAKIVAKKSGIRGSLASTRTNIELGINYIKELERKYRGNRVLALAAYNWGPAKVDRANRNPKLFPSSVQHYANKIIERNMNWANHYKKALQSAESLDPSSADATPTAGQA